MFGKPKIAWNITLEVEDRILAHLYNHHHQFNEARARQSRRMLSFEEEVSKMLTETLDQLWKETRPLSEDDQRRVENADLRSEFASRGWESVRIIMEPKE
jgi:hypothetical protein